MLEYVVMLPSLHKQVAPFLFFLFLHIIGALSNNNTDHFALIAIKSKIIDGPQGVMSSWNDSIHFCQWQGVTCGRRHKRVIALDLPSKGLGGSLSPYVGNMSFLREIHLQNNSLEGGIPPEVGRLFRLQHLILQNNSFEGEIPTNLSHCSNLRILGLGKNKLVGKIPKEFNSLLMLNRFAIHYNNLIGGIPPFIGNLTSLESISLAECHLGGPIPDAFHRLKNLRLLFLGENDLVGTIPSSVYNLSLLDSLDMGGNQIRGSLPPNFGLMFPRLQFLRLTNNSFTGSLPPSVSNCSELRDIDLTANNFHGKIDINFGNLQNLTGLFLGAFNFGSEEYDEMKFIDSLSNCSNLEILELAQIQLRGVLPNSLGNFSTKLGYIGLSTNSIYGILPSSIGNLIGLTMLVLDNNQFTGTIPSTIGCLPNLQILNLGNNSFSGKIPDSIGNLSLLVGLSIHNNRLEGHIPSSIGNCHNLLELTLDQNNLSGAIPSQLFGLSSLSIGLNLSHNHFSGPLPPEVGNLKNLNHLSLLENDLSGELPSSLGSCTTLEILELSSNFFQGPIPPSLESLRALLDLDLSSNNFSGHIPTFLEHIPLLYLNLSFNNFEGEVPVKGVFANASALSVAGNNGLCGGMLELQLPKCRINNSKTRRKLSLTLIIAISISSTLVCAAMVFFVLFCWCRKKKKDQPSQSLLKESFEKVSYERLLKATEGFSSENLIGAGGFASVYKGVLDEDDVIVAVKVLNLQRRGGSKSFIAECEALRNIRHRNLVKVITCCSSVDFQGNDFKALVYEFMPNGSLERWLHSNTRTQNEQDEILQQLGLVQRISIAIDVACALDYLHHRCENTIVHCDLKPSNVLLDQDMVAHVGDFGLSKFLLPELNSNANQTSSVGIRGTVGYTAPEYGLGSEVSTNGDVYSYGILLLEMVTGKKPTDPIFQEGLNLHNYTSTALTDRVIEIVDPVLLDDDDVAEACLISLVKIGVACSMESPQDRMDISSVLRKLRLIGGGHSRNSSCSKFIECVEIKEL